MPWSIDDRDCNVVEYAAYACSVIYFRMLQQMAKICCDIFVARKMSTCSFPCSGSRNWNSHLAFFHGSNYLKRSLPSAM